MVQFNHRCLAYTSVGSTLALAAYAATQPLAPGAAAVVRLLPLAVGGQMCLGIATLLLYVPIELGVAHQARARPRACARFGAAPGPTLELGPQLDTRSNVVVSSGPCGRREASEATCAMSRGRPDCAEGRPDRRACAATLIAHRERASPHTPPCPGFALCLGPCSTRPRSQFGSSALSACHSGDLRLAQCDRRAGPGPSAVDSNYPELPLSPGGARRVCLVFPPACVALIRSGGF